MRLWGPGCYLLGPADADPDMIGALIAAMLKDMPPFTRP